ncbi:hypothetical protein DPX16_20953 [Anabarilius grahami]|uniref:Uncharacterized protein n=1 Tax=Anabarilius grahami TaxID=495550 RepID=A0A3N0YW14_ANAGA|nr:hypothetical protein DPX16_20953 [Anabarilius grahami]
MIATQAIENREKEDQHNASSYMNNLCTALHTFIFTQHPYGLCCSNVKVSAKNPWFERMHERVECSKMQRDTQVCDSTRVAQSSESSQHLRQFERHTSPRGSCSQLQSASARWTECQRTDLSLCYALRERCHTHTRHTNVSLSLSHSLSPNDRKSSAVPYEYLSPSRNLFPLALSPCCFQPFNQSMMEAALSPFDISNLTHLYHCKYTNTHTPLLPHWKETGTCVRRKCRSSNGIRWLEMDQRFPPPLPQP